ncbi:polysaccharide deacetylase family protein [Flavobacterium sp. JP2137]|uniref:polysaccharide deacetylase family protein n=1 Tax=Flavobacterium sp. JP2137 TaxID=3414510 RepID=UPI003D2F9E5D
MNKLPILMYHNVTQADEDSFDLTISVEKLEAQLAYLKQKGYETYHLGDLENRRDLAVKSVVLTFDDVTVDQLIYAVPLLEKYKMKATFFVPFMYLGKTASWTGGTAAVMDIDQLKALPRCIELGFHSYEHRHYAALTEEEIHADFDRCHQLIQSAGLTVYPAVAYPYGNFPKKEPQRSAFFDVLRQNGMKMGLRIGNKVNAFPFKEPFEIKRLDVKGQDSLRLFKLKLRFGKLF